jgi:DAK2 domain fusion protein YloV
MAIEEPVTTGPRRVLTRCDGYQLRGVVETATAWLMAHAHEVDALNVYPVPDGDTGANMSQTMRAAAEAGASDEGHAGRLAARLAHGALMGARGNSGVILSQLLRGFARALDGQSTFAPPDLAAALQEASATAYRAVMKPVEGTVLTVSRVAAEEAVRAAAERPDFLHVLGGAVSAARRALQETRFQLPALRQAGVVDAGGLGYLLLLEGALRHLQGKRAVGASEVAQTVSAASRATAAVHAQFDHTEAGFGYCTEFLIAGTHLQEDEVRRQLAQMGDSLLVVGEPTLLRVHIHTEDPGRAMSYAGSLGRLRRVKVQDMQAQHEEFATEMPQEGSKPPAASAEAGAEVETLPIGIVAVTTGQGFAELFASLGATVVPGGQTMNPSTEQILAAVNGCPQDTVIVLPNNGNVILTAQQAADLSTKTVHVLPTETVPQGIAALLSIRYDEETEAILTAMREAAAHVRTAELTTAVRDVEMDGLQVKRGDILGLLDGKLVAAGEDWDSVVSDLLDRMPAERYEMVTVYAGAEATPGQRRALADLLARRYPNLQVEEHNGGQPHYQFVLSME